MVRGYHILDKPHPQSKRRSKKNSHFAKSVHPPTRYAIFITNSFRNKIHQYQHQNPNKKVNILCMPHPSHPLDGSPIPHKIRHTCTPVLHLPSSRLCGTIFQITAVNQFDKFQTHRSASTTRPRDVRSSPRNFELKGISKTRHHSASLCINFATCNYQINFLSPGFTIPFTTPLIVCHHANPPQKV